MPGPFNKWETARRRRHPRANPRRHRESMTKPAILGLVFLGVFASCRETVAADEGEPAARTKEAAPAPEAEKDKDKDEWYSIHGQATVVSQGNWKFRSPYV